MWNKSRQDHENMEVFVVKPNSASRCSQWRNASVLLSHLTNKETKGQRDAKQGAPLVARGTQEPRFAEALWPCLARRQPRIMARGASKQQYSAQKADRQGSGLSGTRMEREESVLLRLPRASES